MQIPDPIVSKAVEEFVSKNHPNVEAGMRAALEAVALDITALVIAQAIDRERMDPLGGMFPKTQEVRPGELGESQHPQYPDRP